MSRKKRLPYVPVRPEWLGPRRPIVGIFGPYRDFPLTTKELAEYQKRQRLLFSIHNPESTA
jgi:hypothetical protein